MPARIVSLLPAATDIVAVLGLGAALVGRTHECDWPPEVVAGVPVVTQTSLPTGLGSREISAALGHAGSGVYAIDHEALAAARPDVILTQDLCQACAVSYRTVNDAVRILELDATVVSLEPRTIGGILDAIDAVADLLGVPDRAASVRTDLSGRLAGLPGAAFTDRAGSIDGAASAEPADVTDRAGLAGGVVRAVGSGPRVLFVEWLDPFMPGGHWVPEQIILAGGVPVLLGPGEHSVPYPWPVVAGLAADVVVVGPCGLPVEQTVAELSTDPRPELAALAGGPVWIVDGPAWFNRPGPRVVDGAEVLAGVLAAVRAGVDTAPGALRLDLRAPG